MRYQLYQPLSIHELGQRDQQEDAIYPIDGTATTADRLFIVCDGMGGLERGEVASQTFSQALGAFFRQNISPDEPFDRRMLQAALDYAYAKLDSCAQGFEGMGTTLTLVYLHRGGALFAHIGDSRIYHIRPGKGLLYVSRDHSQVFELYASGLLSFEEMHTYPERNVITRAVVPGAANREQPDVVQTTDVEPGDYFFLCSDGVLEQMSDAELFQLISSPGTDQDKMNLLAQMTAGNGDNHTATLIHVANVAYEPIDATQPNDEATSLANALNIRPGQPATASADNADDVSILGQHAAPAMGQQGSPRNDGHAAPRDVTNRNTGKRRLPLSAIMGIAATFVVAIFVSFFAVFNNSGKSQATQDVDMEAQGNPVPITTAPAPDDNIDHGVTATPPQGGDKAEADNSEPSATEGDVLPEADNSHSAGSSHASPDRSQSHGSNGNILPKGGSDLGDAIKGMTQGGKHESGSSLNGEGKVDRNSEQGHGSDSQTAPEGKKNEVDIRERLKQGKKNPKLTIPA